MSQTISQVLHELNTSNLIKLADNKVLDQFTNNQTLLPIFWDTRKRLPMGTGKVYPIDTDIDDPEFFKGLSTYVLNDTDTMDGFVFYSTFIQKHVVVAETDRIQNTDGYIDLIARKSEKAMISMKQGVDGALAGTAGTIADPQSTNQHVWSILDMLPDTATSDPSAGAFGGISRVTNAYVRPKVTDLSATTTADALTEKQLMDYLTTTAATDGKCVDLIICADDTFSSLASSQVDNRWINPTDKMAMGERSIGAAALKYTHPRGTGYIIPVTGITANRLYGIRRDYTFINVEPEADLTFTEFTQLPNQRGVQRHLTLAMQFINTSPIRNGVCILKP